MINNGSNPIKLFFFIRYCNETGIKINNDGSVGWGCRIHRLYIYRLGLVQDCTQHSCVILNKSWRQHPTRHQLYGHLSHITKTIQVRRTRHAGHCLRSRDELVRDVLLWTPIHGRAKAGRPARTYIQQLCEDTGCCPEELPGAMNDREEWRVWVGDIHATKRDMMMMISIER